MGGAKRAIPAQGLFQVHSFYHGSTEILLEHDQVANGIAWAPFMGNGVQPEIHRVPTSSFATVHDVSFWIDLSTNNIPAFIEEPYMPPPSVLKWRVYFYYQSSMKIEDYWKAQCKFWNKAIGGSMWLAI